MPLTIEQFGQKIKSKYPQYNDLSDTDVAQKVLAKYPQYQDMVQKPQQAGFLGSAAGAINKGYEMFTKAPVVKQFATGIGNIVGEAGQAIGGVVGTVGQTGIEAYKGLTGKGFNVGNITDVAFRTSQETGQFGKQIGEAGAPVSLLGGAGRLVNLALAGGMGYNGYKTLKQGWQEKDYAKVYAGLQDMAVAGFGLKEGLAKGEQGLLIDPKLKSQIKSEIEYLKTGVKGQTPMEAATQKAAQTYREILRPTQGELKKIELRKGKNIDDYFTLMAREGIKLNKDVNGRLDVTSAKDQLRQKVQALDDKQTASLKDFPYKLDSIDDLSKKAQQNAMRQQGMTSDDKLALRAEVANMMASEKQVRGARVNPQQIQDIKRTMWNATNFDQARPMKPKAAYIIGETMMKYLEKIVPQKDIHDTNSQMGEYLQAMKILDNAHGRAIKGGILPKSLAGVTGAVVGKIAGAPIVGPIIGAKMAENVYDYATDPARLTEQAQRGMEQAKKLPPPMLPQVKKNFPIGLSIKDVSKEVPYKETGNLTTKILKDLEGKTNVSKQYIMDATNRPDLKQVERDVIRGILENEKGTNVNVQQFADKVKQELLPLKVNSSNKGTQFGLGGRYENITLPKELRGNIKNYKENIYESPIKTSAGSVHFSNSETQNYFGHTRVEDMADNSTRRVIEVQSDLYQKGNLEKEQYDFKYLEEMKASKKAGESYSHSDFNRLSNLEKEFKKNPQINPSKLQQYNDPTAHFRIIREEVKQAAIDGKTNLQFPTGETAMKIEGLAETENPWGAFVEGKTQMEYINPSNLKYENLSVGIRVRDSRVGGSAGDWIITDVLGDGKFKAVPKKYIDEKADIPERFAEIFDISGKIDTNNPIYKFYEKDVGKYLKSRYGAELKTDNKGVTWWEVPVKKDWAKIPVEAFATLPFALGLFPQKKKKVPFSPSYNR